MLVMVVFTRFTLVHLSVLSSRFLAFVVGVRWRHFVQLTQNRVFSPIPTRFHLKAKRVVTKESSQHGGRRRGFRDSFVH